MSRVASSHAQTNAHLGEHRCCLYAIACEWELDHDVGGDILQREGVPYELVPLRAPALQHEALDSERVERSVS